MKKRKTIPLPSQQRLKELFDFDPIAGVLIWRFRLDKQPQWNGRFAGKVAGGLTHVHGYRVIVIDGYGPLLAHRLIWKWLYDEEPPSIDHRDGDKRNNRPENLRAANHFQNMRNKKPHAGKTLPKGVSRYKGGRYRATIYVDGRHKHLGVFDTEEEAHDTYCAAAQDAFGEFARVA